MSNYLINKIYHIKVIMKNLIRLGFIAFLSMAVSLLTINNTFAQGQGQGQGKGLTESRGIQNGEGFTTGQGHLNGNSAVDLVDCVAMAIEGLLSNPSRNMSNPIVLSDEVFSIDET